MTNKTLYKKHSMVFNDDGYNSNSREHCNISIEFAEQVLCEVLKEYKTENAKSIFKGGKFKTIDEIILEKIKQLNNDK